MEPSAKRIVVFSKIGCPFCSLLKSNLTRKGFSYDEIDLTDDATRQAFYANVGVKTVPQLFITDTAFSITEPSGDRIGGWTEVNSNWQALEVAR